MSITSDLEVRARIVTDPDPEFKWDDYLEAFRPYTWHSRYTFGPPHQFTREEVRDRFDNIKHYYLDLFMFEHGAVDLSLSPFSCRFDSGRVGVVVVNKEDLQIKYGFELSDNDQPPTEVTDFIQDVLNDYVSYINNEVYGIVVETRKTQDCACCSRPYAWEEEDSIYGFYGYDFENNGVNQTIKDMTDHFDKVEVVEDVL